MHCADIRERLRADEPLSGPGLSGHLEQCAACAALAADGAELGTLLSGGTRYVSSSDIGALLSAAGARVAAERGPLAWLRSRRTAIRAAVVLGGVVLVTLVSWVLTPRVDLDLYPVARMALVLAALAGCAGTAVLVATRSLSKPLLSQVLLWGAVALSLAAPFALSALPMAHALHPASLAGAGADFGRRALACFFFGLELGVPVFLLALAVDREGQRRWHLPVLGAAAAGLAGNLALQMHCPITHSGHLLWGHATVGLALAIVWGGVAYALRARASARPIRHLPA